MSTDTYRPVLNPGVRPLWRDSRSLQLGLESERATIIDGVDGATARLITELDGTRTEAEVLADAAAAGLDIAVVTQLLSGLRRHRLIVDGFPVTPKGLSGSSTMERLAPDRVSIGLARPENLATQILERRRRAAVVVHGAGRVGTPLAALLAAAGVGNVVVVDDDHIQLADVAPGGVCPSDEGRLRTIAAAEAVRRCAPEVDTTPLPPSQDPDLVVLTLPTSPSTLAALHATKVAHLVAAVRETTAIVGPLVQPGYSTCLRCLDLQRTDRDPAWPMIAAQLATPKRGFVEPCDVVLATIAASVAAMQCLTHLDQAPSAATGSTLELALPDWRIRRRTWLPHPDCDCGATQARRAG